MLGQVGLGFFSHKICFVDFWSTVLMIPAESDIYSNILPTENATSVSYFDDQKIQSFICS